MKTTPNRGRATRKSLSVIPGEVLEWICASALESLNDDRAHRIVEMMKKSNFSSWKVATCLFFLIKAECLAST